MAGESRRHSSKWDTMERLPNRYSSWMPPPKANDGRRDDGWGTAPNRGSGGHEQENHEGFNKDMKEIQSKLSSERSQPSKLADERDDNVWEKASRKLHADDGRRDDGWGTAPNRGSGGHEQENHEGFNKDMKEIQSKLSSERPQPSKLADERDDNVREKACQKLHADDGKRDNGWGTAPNRYSSWKPPPKADDGRRDDGWGTAPNRGSGGHEQENHERFNKDMKEIQSKLSSERSQPSKLADERDDDLREKACQKLHADDGKCDDGWARLGTAPNCYSSWTPPPDADDGRRDDGWGTVPNRGSGGHEQENHEGFNKDMKEIQSKLSSERSQPSKLADEHDDSAWENASQKLHADDGKRDDGWGTSPNRYSSWMPLLEADDGTSEDGWGTSPNRGSGGHKQENHEGLNKDMKEIQSILSSEISQPSKLADEHDDNVRDKLCLEKPHADDGRRDDGWGTAPNRYSSWTPPDADAWRQHSRSPSPRGVWNRSHRNRSRSRSRSRSRNRSRSRSRGQGRGRSRSPYFVDRGPEWRTERGRTSGGPLTCRDFVAGRCRRGLNCRFSHEDGGHRPFEEHHRAGTRERSGYQSKEFMASREQDAFLPSRQSHGRYDDGTWERSEPRRDYRSTEQCYNFAKGRCNRGASCRFAHDDSAPPPHGGWRDEARKNTYDRVGPDSSYGNRIEQRRVNKNPCKFFAAGQCRRGANCPYLHEEAPQSQMGRSAPDEPSNNNDGPAGRGNFSNWGEQINATHETSQIVSRDNRENPISQSIVRNGSRYEYENHHPKDAGSQVQKSEVAASQHPSLLTHVQTSANSMNDMVSGTDGYSAPGTAGSLSMHKGMHAGNVAGNLGQIVQSQDAISQIRGPPTLPVTTQLHNNTSSLPSNSHMQQSNFSVHPQEQFLVTHAAANSSTHNVQDQQVAPHMGHSQLGYGLGAQALPNLPAHSGHNFSVADPVLQHRPTNVYAGQSQAAIDFPRLGQDSGAQAQSIQNMQNFHPVAPNGQTQNQSLQGLSLLPDSSSADMVGVPVSHNAPKSEDIQRVTASLAQYFGNAGLSGTAGHQPSEPNMNTSLMVSSSAAPSAVQPNPWSWAQQHAGVVQPAPSVPPEQQQQAPQTFQMPMAVGSSDGYKIKPLPHSGASTVQAATSVVNETTKPSENKKGEKKDPDAEGNEDCENKKSKDSSKALKLFKIALADFVKEALKPTWKEGQLSREVHKTIVKKVVDKVTSTVENIPPTKEKIDMYMSFSKDKLNKLVKAYVDKYAKESS